MEAWFYNGDYCGKRLTFAEGYRCSLHYHLKKHETFLIIDGTFHVEIFEFFPEKNAIIPAHHMMKPGDVITIPPNTIHRMTAVGGNAALIEFSTHHEDEDSYRVESGQAWEV